MNSHADVVAGVGLKDRPRKSRWPARMDLAQSGSGLLLGLFMWGHMFFVSSILVSEEFMWKVTKMFEGYFVFGKAYPGIVSCVVAGGPRLKVWQASSWLNDHHMAWAWWSLLAVCAADLYVRLCSMGVITDWRLL